MLIASLGACDDRKPEEIQWQLPLEAPEDPHGGGRMQIVPEWATLNRGDAEFVWLQKHTAQRFAVRVASDAEAGVGGWRIQLLGLASGLRIENNAFLDDENVDNPAAFVRISRDGRPVYTGWLYQKFPELFGLDDPVWKVWLKGINLRPASGEDNTTGSLSSAG